MSTVVCFDTFGNPHTFKTSDLRFSPAVYGIFIEHEQLLLQTDAATKLWRLPGGRLASSQAPKQAMRVFFRQATGLTPIVGSLVFIEDQYVVDAEKRPWHLSVMYYQLHRSAVTLSTVGEVDIVPAPVSVPIAELRRERLFHGYEAIQAAHLRHQQSP